MVDQKELSGNKAFTDAFEETFKKWKENALRDATRIRATIRSIKVETGKHTFLNRVFHREPFALFLYLQKEDFEWVQISVTFADEKHAEFYIKGKNGSVSFVAVKKEMTVERKASDMMHVTLTTVENIPFWLFFGTAD